jgi:two-component system, chemotaxis family, chemotaxis protein CheY
MSPINSFLRILIVDNDAVSRASMGLLLSGEGYHVSQAANSEQAIALFRHRPFDLVITELNLEGKDGFELIAELRREPQHVRFIALVQLEWISADFCLRKIEDLCAQAVFAKPFLPEQLLPAVRNTLALNC